MNLNTTAFDEDRYEGTTRFSEYLEAKERGATAAAIWLQAKADGLSQVPRIRLIRELFGLSLIEAKEVSARADGTSLDQQQAALADGLAKALQSSD